MQIKFDVLAAPDKPLAFQSNPSFRLSQISLYNSKIFGLKSVNFTGIIDIKALTHVAEINLRIDFN